MDRPLRVLQATGYVRLRVTEAKQGPTTDEAPTTGLTQNALR